MIEVIEEERVTARCAACKGVRELSLVGLEVRVVDSTTAVVALPPCGCGAVEYLVRAVREEHPQPGSESHRHQLLVEHLHAELVVRKLIAKGSEAAEQLCAPVAEEVLTRWFGGGGLRLTDVVAEPGQ